MRGLIRSDELASSDDDHHHQACSIYNKQKQDKVKKIKR